MYVYIFLLLAFCHWTIDKIDCSSGNTHDDSSGDNKGIAAPIGCPFKNQFGSLSPNKTTLQFKFDCELQAEGLKREQGTCINAALLGTGCKPPSRGPCSACDEYRSIDGYCNNFNHPYWGNSGTHYARMIPPDYGDNVSSFRMASDGNALPNARFLSQKLYSKKIKADGDASLLFLSFGLFIDYDMMATARNLNTVPCCDKRYDENPKSRPKECLQINILPDDPFYGPKNVTCLEGFRSVPVIGDCIGRREQSNEATAFLDASAIYGSTVESATALRTFSMGLLKTQLIKDRPFMEYTNQTRFSCASSSGAPLKCFTSGDARVNMLVDLTVMHVLWLREHNRIAMELSKLNPKWNDKTLYQEARRIVIAEIQHITYYEFLPLLLGELNMNIKVYDGYDNRINPSIMNVFGAAAFRFGHSLAQNTVNLARGKYKIPLHETIFNPELLLKGELDLLIMGAVTQKLQTVDSYITEEIRGRLFQHGNQSYGYDLAAIGIQRGRDHGLPSYTKWRVACGLSAIKSWDDLNDVMDPERANNLKQVYQSIDDIDLIPGALAENHVEGAMVGPTHHCLISRQFRNTRKGDRYWYEVQGQAPSFKKEQLEEIYKSSLARIICDNSDHIMLIQEFPFKISSNENRFSSCTAVPRLNLSEWKVKNTPGTKDIIISF